VDQDRGAPVPVRAARARAVKAPEVRILAGRWKGRRLTSGPGARPTSSRARAALFDILGPRVAGARVLDLYAGTGAVGFEAVSRGAQAAMLVESDAAPLRRSAERVGAGPAEIVILEDSASPAAERLAGAGERFDLVFADPPYAETLEGGLPGAIGRLLAEGGLFVLQQDEKREPPGIPGLTLLRERAYGRNVFLFFGMR
jgi:16S rRNA (guanine966-N2)-methyltransferase